MPQFLAIADDLSGATEIAGIGHRFGLSTQILRDPPHRFDAQLTVLDTDSRSLPAHQAAETVRKFIASVDPTQFDLIYKKTDSALRGQIHSEVTAILESLHFPAAMLLAQNPSRGRTIESGEYRIDGIPLHQTPFATDPDHPALTSDVAKLLGPTAAITICDASNLNDVQRWAQQVTKNILPAGGADFFTALLELRGLAPTQPFASKLPGPRRLFICGSASAYSRELIARAAQEQCALCLMPDNVFQGGDVSAWATSVCEALRINPRVLVAIAAPLQRDPLISRRLQSALAELVASVLPLSPIDHLFLEGGATASAVCRRMGWNELQIENELAPGIVQLKTPAAQSLTLLIKPGSYPWPPAVWL